jgi:pimeloyl-ACP methyl ester carboxylesterase
MNTSPGLPEPGERIGDGRDIPLERAPTEFIDAAGIRFAYRRLGPRHGTPLLLLQHFTGTMDSWDPAVVNRLAQCRPVIVFDNTGVGMSSGTTPDNVHQMSTEAELFIGALHLDQVDLLGYSLGGFVAQILAAGRPGLVRKLVLVATAPQGGEEHLLAVLAEARSHKDAPDPRLPLFFTSSEASRAAGLAFLQRASIRTADRDPESGNAVSDPQAKALIGWCATRDPQHGVLKAIHQPVLVVSGIKDTMLPVENAYVLSRHLDNAQLIVYPDSGHGVLFQYPELFVSHVQLFLDR